MSVEFISSFRIAQHAVVEAVRADEKLHAGVVAGAREAEFAAVDHQIEWFCDAALYLIESLAERWEDEAAGGFDHVRGLLTQLAYCQTFVEHLHLGVAVVAACGDFVAGYREDLD